MVEGEPSYDERGWPKGKTDPIRHTDIKIPVSSCILEALRNIEQSTRDTHDPWTPDETIAYLIRYYHGAATK